MSREPDCVFARVRGDGAIDTDTNLPVPWWSLTKTALAAAALRLAERGELALDTTLHGGRYTLRQLLQHTAGVRNYGGKDYRDAVARCDPPWTREKLLARIHADRPAFSAGTGWAYSNTGYLFVREAIEEATGRAIGAALRSIVFGPLDLSSPRVATSPEDLDGTVWGNRGGYHPGWVYHGLLVGTPADAAVFLHRLLCGDFLSRESRAAMLSAQRVGGEIAGRPWILTGYGLGVMIGEMRGAGAVFGHSGAGPGTVAALYHFAGLADAPTVAAFAAGDDEGVAEWQALRLAHGLRGGSGSSDRRSQR